MLNSVMREQIRPERQFTAMTRQLIKHYKALSPTVENREQCEFQRIRNRPESYSNAISSARCGGGVKEP
jgi:hypothetical protein